MAQVISMDTSTAKNILETLRELKREVARLSQKIEAAEPPYGSKEWWARSDARALKSIREGKGTLITNKKELTAFFKSL